MAQLAGDHVQVLVGGYELTGDHNRITIDDAYKTLDATAFSDAVHKFIRGQRQMKLAHRGYVNAAAGRSHPVLKGVSVDGVVSVLVGQNADPAAGDPVYNLLTRQEQYKTLPEINQVIPFDAAFANRGDRSGWGVILGPPTSFTNTSNGNSVDGGAASSNGGAAFLHVLQAAASDTYTIVVEGADDSGFTTNVVTLGTFTLDASGIGSERLALAGTISRYVRWKATRTGTAGDTVRIAVALIRF